MTPIYVLHCAELAERTAKCREHLAERGTHVTFWRSVHGLSWGLRTTKEFAPGEFISPGHVGLNLGFWNLCQHLLHARVGTKAIDPDDSFVILEDDVTIPRLFEGVVADLQCELLYALRDWDLVFLGLAETEPHVWSKVTERLGPPNSRLCRLNDPFGTHAILLRRRAIPPILDAMAAAERNLDQQLWERVLKKGKLSWCAVLPSIVTQRTFDYTGSGKPEWAPSTIDPNPPIGPVGLAAKESEIAALIGVQQASKATTEVYAQTMELIDPFPCIYRGEGLDDNGVAVVGDDTGSPRRVSVPLFQCARLSKPCHTRRGLVNVSQATDNGTRDVENCGPCKLRAEMSGDVKRDRLPLTEGHFNPSICMWQGRLVLATRDSWGHSKVALWHLDNDKPDWTGKWAVSPIGTFASEHLQAPRLEDPRLFVAPDDTGRPTLCAMFNLPDGYPPKRVQVGYARSSQHLTGITDTQVFRSPHNHLYEKNWVPFFDGHELRWVYSSKPDHVVLGQTQAFSTPNPLPWTGGVIRGGAAPVPQVRKMPHGDGGFRDANVYYHFFHGCLKRVQGSVYTIGCTVFEANPPFKVLKQTSMPLAWPDLPAVGEDVVKRYVLWPGGAVPHAGAWHVAVGIDDTNCRILRFTFEEVEAALNDVPETASAMSLRDTPLARGTNS